MEAAKIFDRTRRHENREDLVGEHAFGDAGQIILLVIFLAVWISDAFFLHYSDFLSQYIPGFVKIPVAVILFLGAGYLARNGLRIVFGEVRETPGVIRKGVFGRVRHPIYLGAVLVYCGWLVLRFSLAAALIWIGIMAFYHFLARHEEQLLLKKFGQEYADYMREVPMWIPRVTTK
jgi:protein-S-isoprenylcysteine O-methyltransferase Ste14